MHHLIVKSANILQNSRMLKYITGSPWEVKPRGLHASVKKKITNPKPRFSYYFGGVFFI